MSHSISFRCAEVTVARREFETAVSALITRVEEGIVSTLTNAAAFDAERGTALEVCFVRKALFLIFFFAVVLLFIFLLDSVYFPAVFLRTQVSFFHVDFVINRIKLSTMQCWWAVLCACLSLVGWSNR